MIKKTVKTLAVASVLGLGSLSTSVNAVEVETSVSGYLLHTGIYVRRSIG